MQVEVRDLKPKESVHFSFRLPISGVAVDVVGVVAWGDEKSPGIQFTYMVLRPYIFEPPTRQINRPNDGATSDDQKVQPPGDKSKQEFALPRSLTARKAAFFTNKKAPPERRGIDTGM